MDADQYQLWDSIKNGLMALNDKEFQTPRLIRLRTQLAAANDEIQKLYAAQLVEINASRDGAAIKEAFDALRESHLFAISNEAKLLLEGMPGINEDFRVPHKKVTVAELLEASDRILKHAARYKDVFIEAAWDDDFIDDAKAAADALRRRMDNTDTVINRRSRATSSIPGAIRKGRKIMVTIGTTVVAQLGRKSNATDRWKKAARVPGKVGRPKNNTRGRRIDPPKE